MLELRILYYKLLYSTHIYPTVFHGIARTHPTPIGYNYYIEVKHQVCKNRMTIGLTWVSEVPPRSRRKTFEKVGGAYGMNEPLAPICMVLTACQASSYTREDYNMAINFPSYL